MFEPATLNEAKELHHAVGAQYQPGNVLSINNLTMVGAGI
jgi:hypothetical protein